MDNYLGRLLDNRYEILEVIGTGGMAVVYKALCHRLNRLVAVKILKDEYSKDADFHRRFRAESQAVAMLSHPNIVSVYDVSQSIGLDYIVMELIEGITMKQYLDKKGVMTWREALHFSMQIAKGLEHAHGRGIVHRDIKPHNIMVLKDGSVKVADFGIARIASAQSTLTREALGSVHYISPEQAKGGRVDNRCDIYSLGVVMYQMLTGKPPYDGESPVAVAIQHINGKLTPPTQINPQIPKGLEQIIMRCMAVNPDDRYNSASDLLQDMEELRRNPAALFPKPGEVMQPVRPAAATVRRTDNSIAAQKAGYAPRPKDDDPDDEPQPERRNVAAVVAIVVCAIVLVGAIALFAALRSCNSEPVEPTEPTVISDLHTIPKFVGMLYDEINPEDYPFLQFETEEENSDTEKGRIIRQSLEANAEVKGTRTILLTISLGQKTENMIDLTNRSRTDAENWLLGLKMGIRINIEMIADDDVKVGNVIRTDPEKNETISAGDTVTLYISSGKEPVDVPKVVGMNISSAYSLLTGEKFNFNVEYVYTDDEAPKDTVLTQSLEPGTSVQQGASISLTLSSGMSPTEETKETEPPTEETKETEAPTEPTEAPTEPGPHAVIITMTFVPTESDRVVELRLANTVIASGVIPAGESELQLNLEGTGKVTYDVFIDGVFSGPETVDFDE